MNDQKIERSFWRGFCRRQILANSIEIFISDIKTSVVTAAQNLRIMKTFLTLQLSQYHVFFKLAGRG